MSFIPALVTANSLLKKYEYKNNVLILISTQNAEYPSMEIRKLVTHMKMQKYKGIFVDFLLIEIGKQYIG